MVKIIHKIHPEATRLLKDIRAFPSFCEKYLKITTTGGKLVNLKLNKIQRYIHETYVVPAYSKGVPLRFIILKMRQSGVSTFMQALGFWATLGHGGWRSLVVSHDDKTSRGVFSMMRRFYANLPDDGIMPRFAIDSDAKDYLEFNMRPSVNKSYQERYDIVLDSRIEVETAGQGDKLGRSGTYQFAHLTEVARWAKLSESMVALMACCHPEPETCVCLETTARGYNEFYDMWNNSSSDEDDMWTKVFIPWYWDDRYEKKQKESDKHANTFQDDYEKWLFDAIKADKLIRSWSKKETGTYDVSDEKVWKKILWRRYQIKNICKGDVDLFKQEYPATDVEAFRYSGISVWSGSQLESLKTGVCPCVWRGNITVKKDGLEAGLPNDKCFTLEEHQFGRLQIWKHPDPKDSYILACDPAQGKAIEGVGTEQSKRDFSCVQVLSMSKLPLEQVAVWHGNADPDLMGYILVALAKHYNNGLCSWETNSFGMVLNIAITERCKYSRVYLRDVHDTITMRNIKVLGWLTTRKSKTDMVALGKMFVRENGIVLHDSATVLEMNAYADVGNGRFEAAKGHDDRVMALLQALAVAEPEIPFEKRRRERAEEIEKQKKEGSYIGRDKPEKYWHPKLGDVW